MPRNRKFCSYHRRLLRNDFSHQPLEDNPLFTDIKFLLLVMKAIGLFPIYERISNCEITRPRKLNEFYTFFVSSIVIALTGLYIYGILAYTSEHWFYSKRDTDIGYKGIELILNIFTYSVIIFNCRRKSETFFRVINEILKVDIQIHGKFQVLPKNHCDFIVSFLIGIGMWQAYVLGAELTLKSSEGTWRSFAVCLFYVIQNGVIMVLIVFISVILRIICMRLICVNLMIEEFIKKSQESVCCNALAMIGDFSENTLFIFEIHFHLLSIIKSINEVCSLSLVSYMGYAFYTITENIYNIFLELTSDNDISGLNFSWGIFWLILHISLLQLLCENCDQTIRKANATTKILAHIYSKKKDERKIIDKFLIKNLRQEMQFVAYGFFNIDRSTLFKIFSAVTTYLVILIQFKQLEDSKIESQSALTTQKEEPYSIDD